MYTNKWSIGIGRSFTAPPSHTTQQTNDPEIQQLTIFCLHLLQNAVILANTLLMERVFEQEAFEKRMEREDYRALTPLFTSNIPAFSPQS
jgi:hypothetical protein